MAKGKPSHHLKRVRSDSSNLKIMSWNINDSADSVYGPKPLNREFTAILESCDIFCLQETKWEVKIPTTHAIINYVDAADQEGFV